ncbi:hypothetical protein J5N97_001925 [Dioscorea zingiberensis]|uniref:Uncharacterized protein n=1 Tax=Dioscorea zingiberensis TaxID=325984 RepID=A0A9D5BTE0_9LILI|nr:hypothetical protein J5N97_001925 [Dioscorea zingiberensis]
MVATASSPGGRRLWTHLAMAASGKADSRRLGAETGCNESAFGTFHLLVLLKLRWSVEEHGGFYLDLMPIIPQVMLPFSQAHYVLPHPKLNLNDVENGRQSIDDLSSGLKKLHQNLEGNDPIDDIETHAIGSLLPGDEEELLAGIADDLDLSGLPGSLEDLEEYDLFGSGGSWVQFNSPTEHSPMYSISKSPGFRTTSPTNSNYLPGLASILHPQVSNTLKVAPIGSPGRGISNQIFTNTNSAHGSAFQQSHSVPEPQLSHFHGALHSSGPSTSSGSSAVETLSGPQFLWGSPTVEKTNSSVWPQKAVGHQLASNGKGHTHPFSGPHSSFLSSSLTIIMLDLLHLAFHLTGTLVMSQSRAETSYLSPVAYGGMGLEPQWWKF